MIINRVWAMPHAETFKIKPIYDFVMRYWDIPCIDPFARNFDLPEYTNDLDPNTTAQYHLEARKFLKLLIKKKVKAKLVILDPPYSQVQVSRSYKNVGREYKPFGDDNNAVLYREVRDLCNRLIRKGGVVLSFGWNSSGMGIKRGFEIQELLLVSHGAAHNDTICLSEKKI